MSVLTRVVTEAELEFNESWRDVFVLIDIVATVRAEEREEPVTEATLEFASKLWCLLTDPVKTESYRREAKEIRYGLSGVSDDEGLREDLKAKIDRPFLRTASLADVVERGLAEIVRVHFA